MVETVVNIERTTTTTTTSGPPGGANPSSDGASFGPIRLNTDYYRTVPGILKLVQFVSTTI